MTVVRCQFYVRTLPPDGGYFYDHFPVSGYHHDGDLWTGLPPLPNDRIVLHHRDPAKSGLFLVIARELGYSAYGSVNWPVTERQPKVPETIRYIVVPVEGLFINEADREEEDA